MYSSGEMHILHDMCVQISVITRSETVVHGYKLALIF